MPSLDVLSAGQTIPVVVQTINPAPIVEPLDGSNPIDNLMDRFPPEVYQQGRDSHLYRFLTALCGDAGAGLVKRQLYSTRLQFEAEFANYASIDQFYAQTFGLNRLPAEVYSFDPSSQTFTPTQVQEIDLADKAFYLRAQEFFTATRYGNTPLGMATLARAGTGIISDIIEHYHYIFDQYSDLPLGLKPLGTTISTSEFVVIPRFDNSNLDSQFTMNWIWTYVFTPPTLNGGVGRPVPAPTGPNVLSVAKTYTNTPSTELLPEIERNFVDLNDQLRPQGTAFSIEPGPQRYTEIDLNNPPVASSERLTLSRFVTGNTVVNWPVVDPTRGFFIESGEEQEATSWIGSLRELPIVFQTIEKIWAYTEAALEDPDYNTNGFYTVVNGIAPVNTYMTEHIGIFSPTLTAIFPALGAVTSANQFEPADAFAIQDTPLILEGKAIGK